MTAPDWRAEKVKGFYEDYWEIWEYEDGTKFCLVARFDNERTAKHIAASWRMRASMEKFVKRVEAGEIRSKKTYAEFRALLASLEETE